VTVLLLCHFYAIFEKLELFNEKSGLNLACKNIQGPQNKLAGRSLAMPGIDRS
jgi:hypothetical protein